VSDTTIASATSQGADVGGVVRSRMKYALSAAAVALAAILTLGGGGGGASMSTTAGSVVSHEGMWRGLAMLLVPVLVLGLLLSRRHLLEGLMFGILAAILLGLALGVFVPSSFLSIDRENFAATGLILDGMRRGIGVSIFTILLMGLVGGLESAGVLDKIGEFAKRKASNARNAEWWIFGAVSAAVMLTTHSVVAILTVGRLTKETGEAYGLSPYRRANLLDITVCTYPFVLPFFIPTVLAASASASGSGFGMPRLSSAAVGLHNFHSWALWIAAVAMIVTGWGRKTVTDGR
jgi:Na+/H+ antiporter NhaC